MKDALLHDYRGYLGGGVDFAYHASLNLENSREVVDIPWAVHFSLTNVQTRPNKRDFNNKGLNVL